MANNRMFLIHRPSGLAVLLGKRMACEWYGAIDTDKNLEHFYNVIWNQYPHLPQDDFALAMEDCDGAPQAFSDWNYDRTEYRKDGLTQLKVKGDVAERTDTR